MNHKILVIDDEPIVGESLRKTFQGDGNGYKIEIANNGQEGLKKARRDNFDLMIVDLPAFSLEKSMRFTQAGWAASAAATGAACRAGADSTVPDPTRMSRPAASGVAVNADR